jgi:hypothetical protein
MSVGNSMLRAKSSNLSLQNNFVVDAKSLELAKLQSKETVW